MSAKIPLVSTFIHTFCTESKRWYTFFSSILLPDIHVLTNMHTLGLNVLIITKVWLCFILGFNPNLLAPMICCCLNYILILSYRSRISFCGVICSSLFPQKQSCFFFLPFVVFDYLPLRDSRVGYPSKPWAKEMINLENLSISLSSKGFERENKNIYIFFYLFCFSSAGIYLGGKQTKCKQTGFYKKKIIKKKEKRKCSIWVLK